MLAYDYQLLLKHLLEHGVAWAPDQEIVYLQNAVAVLVNTHAGRTTKPGLSPKPGF